jgi:rubredoxin
MEMIRCKVCGYIMPEKKLGAVCPACGVPRTAFEPFKDNVSKKRKAILDLNLHPISVHFPQAFSSVIPPFIILALIFPSIEGELLTTVRVLSYFIPLTVIPAIAAGILDGSTRFKKITTPLLVKKLITATVLFAFSCILALAAYRFGTDYPGNWLVFILALACIACQVILAEIGKTLMNSKMPG